MRWRSLRLTCAMLLVGGVACQAPAPPASDAPAPPPLLPTPVPPTPAPVVVRAVPPGRGQSSVVVRAAASAVPANLPLSVLAGRSGGDLRVTLDALLQENALLMVSAMQAATNARLDESIGVSAALDQNALTLSEIVGVARGQSAAQALVDAWRLQTHDLVSYAGGQHEPPSANLDRLAAQFAIGSLTSDQADTLLQRRAQRLEAVGDALTGSGGSAEKLVSAMDASDELGRPLAAGLASRLANALVPTTTEGADIELRVRLNGELQEQVLLTGSAIEAAADNRPSDAQAYADAAAQAAQRFGDELAAVYSSNAGAGVSDRLRTQTAALVSAAAGGDRRQAAGDIDRARAEVDGLLSSANPLLAPGLLNQQLRPTDQALLSAADAFAARNFTTAYARLHEAVHQAQKPADTLALAMVDRYPGRYL